MKSYYIKLFHFSSTHSPDFRFWLEKKVNVTPNIFQFLISANRLGLRTRPTMSTTMLDAVAPQSPSPVRLECDEVLGPGSLDDEPCVAGPKTEQPVKRKRSASASAEPDTKVACVKDGEEDDANPSPPPNSPGITKNADTPTDPRKQAQQAVAKPNRRGQVSPVLRNGL